MQDMDGDAIDQVARRQFDVYQQLGDEIAMKEQDRRRILLLNERQWADWSRFRSHGPLPLEPALPVMLRRLGSATHRLSLLAGRRNLGQH